MTDTASYLLERDRRRKRKARVLRWGLALGGFVALVFGGAWLIARSAVFRVEHITVIGNQRLRAEDVIAFVMARAVSGKLVGRILGSDNILAWPGSFSAEEAPSSGELWPELPMLRNLVLRRSYQARTIELVIEERQAIGVWCLKRADPERCFWFDADGMLFDPAPSAEGNLIRVVTDAASSADLGLGARPLAARQMTNLQSIFRVLAGIGLGIAEIRLDDLSLEEIRVTLRSGPALFFSLRFPAENTLGVLQSLMAKDRRGELTPHFRELSYIDFRVENRAYYK